MSKKEEVALVAREAERLEDASANSLIYIDARGQVRSPSHYKRLTAVYFSGFAVVMSALTGFYWVIGGPTGLVVGAGLTALMLRHLPAWGRLRRAAALVAAERIDEAEELLRPLQRGRHPAALRGRADLYLSRVAALRGRYAEALLLQESALSLLGRDRRTRSLRRVAAYQRVVTMVNLGRVTEARHNFEALPRTLEGDYLRVLRATAELYLALVEGQHRFDPTFLQEQADIALPLPSARALLSLLAWAQDHAGQPGVSAQLLAAARDKPGGAQVQRLYPRLADWEHQR